MSHSPELELAWMTRIKLVKKNKKGKGKGCFGKGTRDLGDYQTLKVLPRSKRQVGVNCNEQGCVLDQFKNLHEGEE